MLAAHGIRSRMTSSIAGALTAIQDDHFDAILLDPDVGGTPTSLADNVKRFGDIPVIVAASGGAKRAVEAMRSGAADFVEKPFQEAELLYVLEKVITANTAVLSGAPESIAFDPALLGQSKATR